MVKTFEGAICWLGWGILCLVAGMLIDPFPDVESSATVAERVRGDHWEAEYRKVLAERVRMWGELSAVELENRTLRDAMRRDVLSTIPGEGEDLIPPPYPPIPEE